MFNLYAIGYIRKPKKPFYTSYLLKIDFQPWNKLTKNVRNETFFFYSFMKYIHMFACIVDSRLRSKATIYICRCRCWPSVHLSFRHINALITRELTRESRRLICYIPKFYRSRMIDVVISEICSTHRFTRIWKSRKYSEIRILLSIGKFGFVFFSKFTKPLYRSDQNFLAQCCKKCLSWCC